MKQRHYFASKCPSSQSDGFSSSHVWMWELDHKEGWTRKNWCFWTMVLEKNLESPLDCKEIQPVHPKGVQSWMFIGRTDVEAETPILWPPHAKSWLIGKDFDAGRDWGQEEKGTTEDEMAGWHHWRNERESKWTPGVGDGQGGLACCDLWGRKESDTTEPLNWTELNWTEGRQLPALWIIQWAYSKSKANKNCQIWENRVDLRDSYKEYCCSKERALQWMQQSQANHLARMLQRRSRLSKEIGERVEWDIQRTLRSPSIWLSNLTKDLRWFS